MHLEGEHEFEAPVETVFDVTFESDVLEACIPETETVEVLSHDFYEEVYIIEGAPSINASTRSSEPELACRTPRMGHGPYRAPVGCMTIEF